MTLALDLERARDLLLLSSQAYLPPAVELPARLSAEVCRPLLGADNLPERQDLGREGSDSLIAHAFTIDPEREIVVAFPGAKINWNCLTGPDLEILQKNLPREYDKAADFVDRLHREHPNAHIIATGRFPGRRRRGICGVPVSLRDCRDLRCAWNQGRPRGRESEHHRRRLQLYR